MKNIKNILMKIALLILFILGIIGGIIGYFTFFYQKEAVINDYTETQLEGNDMGEEGDGNEPEIVISSNVIMFTEEEVDKINKSIQSIQVMNTGIHLKATKGSALDNVSIGDIFYLDGNEKTPLGEIYIGKVSSKSENDTENTYILETPMVDEVFDILKFEYSQIMTTDNISEIQTVEGVSVTITENLEYDLAQVSKSNSVSTLAYQKAGELPMQASRISGTEGLIFDFNVDLLKTYGLEKDKSGKFQERYDGTEGGRIIVYKSKTGKCYHRNTCACVGKSKTEMTLSEAVLEKLEPCHICIPPVIGDDKTCNFTPSLTLEGKVGLENVDFNINYEWDIINGSGLEELGMFAKGNVIAEAEVKSNVDFKFGGKTTTITIPVANVKLQGLKEKLFPLAFIAYNGTITPVVSGNESIRTLTGAVPLTVGAMVYIDISGNISVSAKAYFDYNQSFRYDNYLVKDGEWIRESNIQSTPVVKAGIETELKGDVDAHMGCSIDLYVFNLNVVDLAIVELGGEAEGMLKIDYSNETQVDSDSAISASYYMRIYYKLLELNIKLKTQVQLWDTVDVSNNLEFTSLYLDKTLAEWGSKSPVYYNRDVMSYSMITAQDENAFYYKNTDGKLIREIDEYKTIIYDEDFFSICGIDESYIYVLKAEGIDTYDIYRISKNGNADRKIAESVLGCFTMDGKYLYYLSEFDKTAVYRMDRESLKEELFADFKDHVNFMEKQGEDFYIVTESMSVFEAFLGGAPYKYYLVSSSGDILEEYGKEPDISQYFYVDHDAYYRAAKMTGSGYLRAMAQELYWVSKDKQQNVQTEQISGWKAFDEGICTTLENEDKGQEPYTIFLYRAENGQKVEMTDVYSTQAFFTLCKDEDGSWYFFDQTEQELILYELKGDFSQKKAVKVFLLSEFPCDLTKCSMEIMDNRLYLYIMPDNRTSQVLYRYNIL